MKNYLVNSELGFKGILKSIDEKNVTIVNSETNKRSISIREIIENSITLKNAENEGNLYLKEILEDDIRIPKRVVKGETKIIYYKSEEIEISQALFEEIEISQALFEEIAEILNLVYMQIGMNSPIAVLSKFREEKNYEKNNDGVK